MNIPFVRNFVIFGFILAACMGSIGYFTYTSSKDIKAIDRLIAHSNSIIKETHALNDVSFKLLSLQRQAIMRKEERDRYIREYSEAKDQLSSQVATLRKLVVANPSQTSRLTEIEHLSFKYKDALEENLQSVVTSEDIPTITGREIIFSRLDEIHSLVRKVLDEEYELQTHRASRLSATIYNYQISLWGGGIIASIIILIFNWFLMQAQGKVSTAESSLQSSEERFRLAIRGSQDGIFDWDFKNHTIYWSPQFKAMLGYADDEIVGDEETLRRLLHPDDADTFWASFNNYINGELSEFSAIYRMMHKSGRPIWINGRGKAIFDEERRPMRFIGAHTDISYIKEHERQLKEERDRAASASEAKGEFLAHMSHEIRTPLTAISGIAEILGQTPQFEDPKKEKLIKTLSTSTQALKELITDILDFSKIESGEIELENRNFKLGELFEQITNVLSVRVSEKKLYFTFDYGEVVDTTFYGDSARMRQIIMNILSNAIKFTEVGQVKGKAYLETVADVNILRVDITDTGIGISPKSMDVIFEKFKQADSSVSRRYGGTGLGLPISMNLTELMGGTIKVVSEVGKGSTFSIILPFRNGLSTNNYDDDMEPLVDMSDVMKVQKLNDRLKAVVGDRKRVLLVEDYEGNIVVLSYILSSLDFDYDVAKTGLQAIQFWKERHYDLILMDIQMPEMDGLTATRTIRKMEEEQGVENTPIIGLTAHALVADKQKCIDSGMNDYLSKPIVEAELKAVILKMLERKNFKVV
jgi:PAS domain S-box-containing protein